jgi:serine/threonine protein kinase
LTPAAVEVTEMNRPEPPEAAAVGDAPGTGEGSSPAQLLPGREPRVEGRSDPSGPGRADTYATAAGLDPVLAELAEEITRRLQVGEAVDADEYTARHPGLAAAIRRLLPILREMAEFARSAGRDREEGAPPGLHEGPGREGRVLGDFRILREVGRGGMGVVYEAEQLSLGRRIALKVLPLAAAMDPRALQRFQLEAQAAALLQHPRVVPVHAVGSFDDVPYYAMQFIEGASLAELVAEMRRLEGLGADDPARPNRAEGISSLARGLLSGRFAPQDPEDEGGRPDDTRVAEAPARPGREGPAERGRGPRPLAGAAARGWEYARTVAHLGVQAAEALEYAHGQGVLHRDVKPANLLLDRRGALWVTDFGLARLPGEGGLTLTGDVLGTLRYMSPEQALARRALVDRRTDVYALGATLYELLTLQPSVPGTDRQEILRRIVEDEPVPVWRLNPAVPVDLATAVAKAMRKDPAGRYQTAQHFADDLRRFLEGRPIAARPTGLFGRGWRWCRRRPLPAGLAAGLVVALVAGAAGVTWSWREAVRQRNLLQFAYHRLRVANEHERESRERAQRQFAMARDAIAQDFIDFSQDVAPNLNMESLRKRLLSKALAFYKRFQATIEEEGGPGDASTRAELAEVYRRVGQIAVEVGSRHEGLEALHRARALFERLARDDPADPGPRRDLASCLEFIGRLQLYTSGQESQGLRALELSLGLYEAISAEHPEEPRDRFAAAAAAGALGYERARAGDVPEGLRSLRRGRDLLERLVAEHPGNASYRNQLALAFSDLAKIQAYAGHAAEALRSQRQAVAQFDRLTADEPGTAVYRRRLGQVQTDLGRTLTDTGRPAETRPHLERGLAVLEAVAAEMPGVDSYQRAVAECRDVLASALARTGRRDDALRSLARARATLARLIADHPDFVAYQADLAENHLGTGAVNQDLGRSAEALRELSSARELLGRMSPGTGILYDLARAESRLVPLTGPEGKGPQADRAMAALTRAVARGYRSPDALRTDPSLDSLRDRGDFQALLLDLQFPDDPFAR